jgi:hypothetical protein
VREHWKTFLADLEARAELPALPAFVVAEVEGFLRCGILAHGFVLARCGDCGWSRPVAFSCQRRGFCPSCVGRRMADFAPHLVDRVAPAVPLRQWVLTVPYPLRARMMYDPADTDASQAGYTVIADCIERPGGASLAAAHQFYDTQRHSPLRRWVRRFCFENSN